jgi:hypothetical protein
MAIVGLILALLGVFTFGLSALVAIVICLIAIATIGKSEGRIKGQGLAVAGLIIAVVIVLMFAVLIGLLVPSIYHARAAARQTVVASHGRQLGLAAIMYANDFDDHLPPADHWRLVLEPYLNGPIDQTLASPYPGTSGCELAYNENLSLAQMSRIVKPSQTVLFFEAANPPPYVGGEELITRQPPRGPAGYTVVFTDGHVENIEPTDLSKLIWLPAGH